MSLERSSLRLLASFVIGSALALSTVGCSSDAADEGIEDDAALQEGTRSWDDAGERAFSDWVAKIGTARAEGRCIKLNDCINDPSINPLKAASDTNLDLFADCADVPMELRGYFAVKTKRAFKYMREISGEGGDLRYSKNNQPTAYATAGGSSTMQRLMTRISANVHSGFFRTAPEVEGTDTYPINPSRSSLKPGSVYYDPAGHVLIVFRVDADGAIWTIDGHPDNSLTFGRFTEGTYAVGSRAQGGGFRNFRPQHIEGGRIVYAANDELADFGDSQYGHGAGYFDWLTTQLGGTTATPEKKLGDKLDQLCIDIQTRVASVDAGRATGLGPIAPQPPNIYAAEGDWEAYSTPSRDGRLRASFRGVYKLVKTSLESTPASARGALVAKLSRVWRDHAQSSACTIRYSNSDAQPVTLRLDDVQARIYDLSFDPYHCPEMRWGAYPRDANEMSSCPNADAEHIARFEAQRRNRNVIDREPVATTGPDYGPNVSEDIDVVGLLSRYSTSP